MSARNRRRMMATPLRRRLAAAAGVLAVAVVAASCASVPVQSLVRGAVAGAAPAEATVARPVVDEGLRPVSDPSPLAAGTELVSYPISTGGRVTVGIVRGTGPLPGRTVVILPGSDGLRAYYFELARTIAAQGYDVVVGCWFHETAPEPDTIDTCPTAGTLGVVEDRVASVQAVIDAAQAATGATARNLSVMGYSRGGGMALLWAARTGATVPIVDVAGMVTGEVLGKVSPGEVDVVPAAAAVSAPVLVVHGTKDGIVDQRQSAALVAARVASGTPVAAHWVEGSSHDVFAHDASKAEVLDTTTAWLATLA